MEWNLMEFWISMNVKGTVHHILKMHMVYKVILLKKYSKLIQIECLGYMAYLNVDFKQKNSSHNISLHR